MDLLFYYNDFFHFFMLQVKVNVVTIHGWRIIKLFPKTDTKNIRKTYIELKDHLFMMGEIHVVL